MCLGEALYECRHIDHIHLHVTLKLKRTMILLNPIKIALCRVAFTAKCTGWVTKGFHIYREVNS